MQIKKSIKKVREFFVSKELFIAYMIIFIVILGSSLAFLFQNNTYTWDTYAHIDSARYIRDNSWPNPVVWNETYFNGYPQNYFYPPLFSFIVATIGFIFPIEFAYKLFIVFLYFLIPIIGYLFASIFYKKREHALQLNIILVLMFFINDAFYYGRIVGIGGTIYSTFYVGLAPALLGTLLLLLFIYFIEKKKNWKYTSMIFALGVISHYIFLISIVYLIVKNFMKKDLKFLKKSSLVFLTGTLLSAWWFVPALINNDFSKTAPFFMPFFNLTTITILLATLTSLKFNLKKERIFVFISILIITLLVMFDGQYQGQLFRTYFILSLFSIPAIYILIKKLFYENKISKKMFPYFFILISILILLFSINIDFTSQTQIEFTDLEKNDSINIALGPTHRGELHHALYYELSNEGMRVQRGLFSEQTPNILFFNGISTLINPDEFIWGTFAVRRDIIDTNNFYELMDYLGVETIITTEKLINEVELLPRKIIGYQRVNVKSDNILWFKFNNEYIDLPIYQYFLEKPKIIEVVNYPPSYFSGEDWEYFSNIYLSKFTIVTTREQVTGFNINKNAEIKNLERTNNKISFFIDSDVDVPVFIKESYFPNWKAYSNGEEIPIYLTAPYFMLINSKGEIELVFEPALHEQLSFIVSFITFILLISYNKVIRKLNQNKYN
jgi:hypothetical protein